MLTESESRFSSDSKPSVSGPPPGTCATAAGGSAVYLPKKTSKARLREAERARDNRREIVKALSHGQINRRDLIRMGLLTASGSLVLTNGLSVFAPSAYAK